MYPAVKYSAVNVDNIEMLPPLPLQHVDGSAAPVLNHTPLPPAMVGCPPRGSPSNQLAAAIKKNFRLRKKHWVGTCVELIIPIVLVLSLSVLSRRFPTTPYPSKNFVDENTTRDTTTRLVTLLDSSLCWAGTSGCNTTNCFALGGSLCWQDKKIFTKDFPSLIKDQESLSRVLDYETMVRLHHAARNVTKVQTVIRRGDAAQAAALPTHIIFTPNNIETNTLIARLNASIQRKALFDVVVMSTMAEAERWAYSPDGEGKVWAIINIERYSRDSATLSYTVRMNRTCIARTDSTRERFVGGIGSDAFKLYMASGFVTIQQWLHAALFAELGVPLPEDAFPTAVVPMPYEAYNQSVFLTLAGMIIPLAVVLSYLYPVSQLAKRIVEEKELRIREGMLIMGLGKVPFYASWLITYVFAQVITSGIMAIILSRGVFAKSAGIVVWIVFLCFGMSVVTLSFLLSSLFSKSRMAALLSPFLFAIISIPMFALPAETAPPLSVALLSPCAFVTALRTMIDYEKVNGIGMGDITSTVDDINVLTSLLFLLLDTVLYFLLSVYLDEVLPSEWGSKRHPLFFLFPSYWCPPPPPVIRAEPAPPGDKDPSGEMGFVERVGTLAKGTVYLRNIRKVFNVDGVEKVAVDGFSTEFYPNGITVLLGHNGAGKTTTINMLTGMLDLTAGDCVVYGKSVCTELAEIRRNMGFCPQHNILWPQLSCWEHLDFYAHIKGLTGIDREKAIDDMLARVGLTPETHKPAGSLSGGQKRKLSVAIAFIGGSQFIILDEPTAGMDVNARHDTWTLLQQMAAGRTILLTTHFMDEADVLGQTVTIMTHGKLYCSGSPMFLKSRLGAGYTLSVAVTPQANLVDLTRLIERWVSDASLVSSNKGIVHYRLPTQCVAKFPDLFRALEESEATKLGIQTFGITNTTLEEVFTKIAVVDQKEPQSPRCAHSSETLDTLLESPVDVIGMPSGSTTARISRHIAAIIRKRAQYTKRDRRALVFQLLMPVVFVVAALLLGKLGPPNMPRLVISPDMYRQSSMLLPTGNCSNTFRDALRVQSNVYTAQPLDGTSALNFSRALLATHNSHGNTERFLGLYCNDSALQSSIIFFNGTAPHALPEGVVALARARLYAATGIDAKITAASFPLDWTQRQNANLASIQSFITAFFILIPFTFVPATYAAWVVKEKECNAKQLQLICGLHPTAYWVANFLWDLVSFLVTEAFVFIIFLIFSRTEYIGDSNNFVATFVVFTFFGLSSISFAYFASHFFTNHSTAQNAVMLTNFAAGFAFILTTFTLDQLGYATNELRGIFRLVPSYCLGEGLIDLALLPIQKEIRAVPASRSPLDFEVIGAAVIYMALEFPILLAVAILLDNPIFLKVRQYFGSKYTEEQPGSRRPADEDPDVVAERTRVDKSLADITCHSVNTLDGDLVSLRGLRKVFPPNNVAVKDLTLGVHRSEIFGFLGTNGAGKTTTLSMLSGEFPPTQGKATLCGFDVVTQSDEARRRLGLCPQFDALLDLLTPREHLELYCALREIPPPCVKAAVDSLMQSAGLTEYADSPSKGLSGGTKRKLSLAIALVGAPSVVFLDEPSAGMDPVARRSMWDTIRRTAIGRCVVLTTHHLEEVEALAHRVAIMVSGELRCIGSLPHLKAKYGNGYELSLKVAEGMPLHPVQHLVESGVAFAKRTEINGSHLKYLLPQKSTQLSLVFDLIESKKLILGIVDYSISQTSLEQVFVRISNDALAANDVATVDHEDMGSEGKKQRSPGGDFSL